MRRVAFTLVTIAMVASFVGDGRAQSKSRDLVEAVLTRSLLERAAFRACAAYENDTETEAVFVRTWRLDLAEAWEVLRAAGYPEDEVRKLIDPLDLDKATPKFANRAALGAFCATIGDWRKRFALMLGVLPQLELRRLLKP